MAATSAGTQNPNEHRCGMVGRWDIRCAGYPAGLTLLHLYQRLLVFFYNNRIGLFNGLPMGLHLLSSKFEIEFLFLGASKIELNGFI